MVSFPMDSGRARRTLEYIPVPVHSNTPRALARVVLTLRATTKSGSLRQLRTLSECYKGGPSLRDGLCEATMK